MPSPSEILTQSTAIASSFWTLAVAWHLVVILVAVGVALGWRPRARPAAVFAIAPIVSAAVIAVRVGNPFNATVLGAVAVGLGLAARRIPRETRVQLGRPWSTVVAGMLIAFGLGYPHFLPGASPLEYAVAAPVGLLPCPTLTLVIGIGLLTREFESKLWGGILAAAGLLYGVIGVMRLGVVLDVVLIAGAVVLAASEIPIQRWRGARAY